MVIIMRIDISMTIDSEDPVRAASLLSMIVAHISVEGTVEPDDEITISIEDDDESGEFKGTITSEEEMVTFALAYSEEQTDVSSKK